MNNTPIQFTLSPSALVDSTRTDGTEFRHLDWTEVHVQLEPSPYYPQYDQAPSSAKIGGDSHLSGVFSLQDIQQETQAPFSNDPTLGQGIQLEEGASDAFSRLHSLPSPIPPPAPAPQGVQRDGWSGGDTGGLADDGHTSTAAGGGVASSGVASSGVGGSGEDAVFFTLNV